MTMKDIEKKVKTAMIALIWLCLGLFQSIGGPTLIDLTIRFHASYDDIGRAMSSVGMGAFVSAMIGGALVDIKTSWQDALIAIPQLFATMSMCLVPVMGDVTTLWIMFFILGTAVGFVNIVSQRMLVNMWKSDATVPFHLIHFALGIGCILAPAVADAFLAELVVDDTPENVCSTNCTSNKVMNYTVVGESRVAVAYTTSGLVTMALSLPFFIYTVYQHCDRLAKGKYNDLSEIGSETTDSSFQKLLKSINPRSFSGGSRAFGIFALICITLHFINSIGGLQAFGNFIRTFSVDELEFSQAEATNLNAFFWISYTIGRLVSTVLTYCISPVNLLFLCTVWHAASAICLLFLASTSHTLMWLFTILVGASIGPTNPAFMAYINTKVDINGVVLTFIECAHGAGSLIYLWVTGVLYNMHGPMVVLYMEVFYAVVILIITLVLVFVARGRDHVFDEHQPVASQEMQIEADMER